MRHLFVVLFILLINPTYASSLDDARSLFFKIEEGKENVVNLQLITKDEAKRGNYVMAGYHAVATATLAQYTMIPTSKYRFFVQGRDMIENAISNAPHNAELRFLRLSMQIGTPVFLNYSQNIVPDREFIIAFLENQNLVTGGDGWFWAQVLLYLRDRSRPDYSSRMRIIHLIEKTAVTEKLKQ